MSRTSEAVVPAISIEGARKEYVGAIGGRGVAVADVSLTVSKGAIHGLLGPNGAGKTTTLKMLLGLVKPSSGRFTILGVDASQPRARTSLGFLPEQPYFPMNLTAIEALRLYGSLARLSRSTVDGQAGELLSRVGLGGQERTQLSRFSRGMLQRLGLAQAMIGAPEVLVLDEPASGLDPIGQRDIRNLMLDLRTGGTTILLSSHQLSEVEAVCDEVTILNRGRVASRGDINRLLNAEGQMTVQARGEGELPLEVAAVVSDTAYGSAVWAFSVAESDLRFVIDTLDDHGWHVLSATQKKDSLEDYFSSLLATPEGEVA